MTEREFAERKNAMAINYYMCEVLTINDSKTVSILLYICSLPITRLLAISYCNNRTPPNFAAEFAS